MKIMKNYTKMKIFKRDYTKQPNKTDSERKCIAYDHDPCKEVYFNHFETLGEHIYKCVACGKETPIVVSMK